jgi:hypothetical protein
LEYAPARDVEGPQRSVMVNPRVLDYETLIVVSQMKLHRTATVTMALKNVAMSYRAADFYGHPRAKEKHHNDFYKDMHSFIAATGGPVSPRRRKTSVSRTVSGDIGDLRVSTHPFGQRAHGEIAIGHDPDTDFVSWTRRRFSGRLWRTARS